MNDQPNRRIPIKISVQNQSMVIVSAGQKIPNDQYHTLGQMNDNWTDWEDEKRLQKEAEVRILSQNEKEVE